MSFRNRQSFANGLPMKLCPITIPVGATGVKFVSINAGCDAYLVNNLAPLMTALALVLPGGEPSVLNDPIPNSSLVDGDTIEVWDVSGTAATSAINIECDPRNHLGAGSTFLKSSPIQLVQITANYAGVRLVYQLAQNAWTVLCLGCPHRS
jgi:hypothetical protein